jgi:multiple sugar transport system ATP-binding protein
VAGVVLDGVTKRFGGVTAVDEVSLEIRDGELLVLVGPSGCGKTTLIRQIAGLEQPTTGDVRVAGSSVNGIPVRERDVGYVFQELALFPHMTVRENLSFNLRMRGSDGADGRVERMAELLDIEPLLDRDIDELSGGQRQRVALGRALATEPRVFLLDEPLASLDAQLRDRMRTEITRLQRRLDTTMVHVTHDQEEAMAMGDRVAVLNDGRLQQVGTPETVYTQPANVFVAEFFGTPPMNLLEGRSEPGGPISLQPSGVSIPVRAPALDAAAPPPAGEQAADQGRTERSVLFGIRPEHVGLAAPDATGGLSATVDLVEYHGTDRVVYLREAPQKGGSPDGTDGGQREDADGDPGEISGVEQRAGTTVEQQEGTNVGQRLVARAPPSTTVSAGDRVTVTLDPEQLHLFDPGTGERIPGVSLEPHQVDSG